MHSDHIEITLKDLCDLYDQHSSENQKIYYFSKLAVLELSGWLEYVVDESIRMHFSNSSESVKTDVENAIKYCNGCKYKENIRPLISKTLGAKNIEKIEEELIKGADLEIITNTLVTLADMRNDLAHTFIISNAKKIDAPSKTLKNFNTIKKPILKLAELIKNAL